MSEPDERLCKEVIGNIASDVNADYLIAHFREGAFVRQALRKSGFKPVPRMGMDFTTRPLQPELPIEPKSMGSWALTLGDLELF